MRARGSACLRAADDRRTNEQEKQSFFDRDRRCRGGHVARWMCAAVRAVIHSYKHKDLITREREREMESSNYYRNFVQEEREQAKATFLRIVQWERKEQERTAAVADIDEFEHPEDPLNLLRLRARNAREIRMQCVEIECTRRFRNECESRGWKEHSSRNENHCVVCVSEQGLE